MIDDGSFCAWDKVKGRAGEGAPNHLIDNSSTALMINLFLLVLLIFQKTLGMDIDLTLRLRTK